MNNNLDQVINFYYFTVRRKEHECMSSFIHLFILQKFTKCLPTS